MNTSIFEKMEIPSGIHAHVLNAPEGYPTDVKDFQFKSQGDHFDFVHVFVDDEKQFAQQLAEGERLTAKGGAIWVSYPKALKRALNEETIRQQGKPLGLTPGKELDLDGHWHAVKMQWLS